MIAQAALRMWPPAAVHDTVAAVLRGRAFQTSLQMSLAQRLYRWTAEGLDALMAYLRGSAPARWAAMAFTVLLVALIIARFVLASRARSDADELDGTPPDGRPVEDPWRAAERLRAAEQWEDAAHALYRGVVGSLARTERIRVDPSRTSGDYARELRARGSTRTQDFRAFARRFDVAVYGHGGCDETALAELSRLAEPFRGARGSRAA